MSKDYAYEAYRSLKETFDLKDDGSNGILEKIVNKNFVLSFYTIWETYVKQKIFDTYVDYEYILHDEDFIKRYLQKSFGKKYLTNLFLNDIKDTRVKKEILCQSNNLNWIEFENLLEIIGLNKDRLSKRINKSEDLKSIVESLKLLGLTPLQYDIGSRNLDGIKGYLNLIIDSRNIISHTYKMEIDEKLDYKQKVMLLNLFKCLIVIIENYFDDEIEKKLIGTELFTDVIQVNKVIRGCNGQGSQSALLEVKVEDQDIDFENKKWIIKNNTSNKSHCVINEIRVDNVRVRKIPIGKKCTLSINTNIKIKNSSKVSYQLCKGVYNEAKDTKILNHQLD